MVPAVVAWRQRRTIVAAGAAMVLMVSVPVAVAITAIAGSPGVAPGMTAPSTEALTDIPADALGAYLQAGAIYGIDWALLAGIGKIECDHGRSDQPGCAPDTVNEAGARGVMQFLGSTWRRGLGQFQLEPRTSPPASDGQGYAADGDNDGHADPWSWPDAAVSAARLLAANGGATDPAAALFAYNHDNDYVTQVLAIAVSYRSTDTLELTGFPGEPGAVPLVAIDGITVHAQLGGRLAALLAASRAAGLEMSGSGYRTTDAQIALRRAHCGESTYAIYEMLASRCSPPTARPGESLHERGLAIDFTCNAALVSAGDTCFRWLDDHAPEFGFYNLQSEPWHWSADGR